MERVAVEAGAAATEEERGVEGFGSSSDEQSCNRNTFHSSPLRDWSLSTKERRGDERPYTENFWIYSALNFSILTQKQIYLNVLVHKGF